MPEDPGETALREAIDQWRQAHRLREDDPILLIVELLRIHRQHGEKNNPRVSRQADDWDAQFDRLGSAISGLNSLTETLERRLRAIPLRDVGGNLRIWTGSLGLLLAAAGGFVLGRGWP